jgi:hypothetical protein
MPYVTRCDICRVIYVPDNMTYVTPGYAEVCHCPSQIQLQKKLERRIHSSRGDVFMNRKTNGINDIVCVTAPALCHTRHCPVSHVTAYLTPVFVFVLTSGTVDNGYAEVSAYILI